MEKALTYYTMALDQNPHYAQAHNNLGSIYAAKNEYHNALLHYKKAVHAEPDFAAAHFNLGLLLLQHQELNAAQTQFNNVITLNPGQIEAQFYLGLLFLEKNELAEAEQAFQAVLALNSEHVEALTNLGVIALKKDKKQEAIDYFSKALALDNEQLDARNNLAATFMHHDLFENALMHYDVLLQKEPDNLEYLYNSGVAQMALGHLNEAILFFEQLLQLQPRHAPALNNMAAIFLRLEQRDKAREFLEKALAINPDDAVSKHMLHALTGNSSHAQTTPEYAANLFNNYALYYDKHMQEQLHYSIPKFVARTLYDLQLPTDNKTLDLGCGTGLTGVVLSEFSSELIGVDVSEKMLAVARNRGIYSQLVCEELGAFLHQDKRQFNLIVAADVLPYFGSLDDLFKAVKKHMEPQAYFLFTTEISDTKPWKLEISARFSHHPDYLSELANSIGLQVLKAEKIPARLQNQRQLEVMLYLLQMPQHSIRDDVCAS